MWRVACGLCALGLSPAPKKKKSRTQDAPQARHPNRGETRGCLDGAQRCRGESGRQLTFTADRALTSLPLSSPPASPSPYLPHLPPLLFPSPQHCQICLPFLNLCLLPLTSLISPTFLPTFFLPPHLFTFPQSPSLPTKLFLPYISLPIFSKSPWFLSSSFLTFPPHFTYSLCFPTASPTPSTSPQLPIQSLLPHSPLTPSCLLPLFSFPKHSPHLPNTLVSPFPSPPRNLHTYVTPRPGSPHPSSLTTLYDSPRPPHPTPRFSHRSLPAHNSKAQVD